MKIKVIKICRRQMLVNSQIKSAEKWSRLSSTADWSIWRRLASSGASARLWLVSENNLNQSMSATQSPKRMNGQERDSFVLRNELVGPLSPHFIFWLSSSNVQGESKLWYIENWLWNGLLYFVFINLFDFGLIRSSWI